MNIWLSIKSYIKSHRRLLRLELPMIFCSIIVIAMGIWYFLSRSGVAFGFLVFSGVLLVLAILFFVYMHPLSFKLGVKNIRLGQETYLNGYPIWWYESYGTFSRIGHYIGRGLCYEMGALLMMVWKDHKKTRLLFCEIYDPGSGEWMDHCLMEIFAFGIWWVMDATWRYPVIPMPSICYFTLNKVETTRIISHEEFFSHDIVNQMARMIQCPVTSYLFNDLAIFAKCYNSSEDLMIFEKYQIDKLVHRGNEAVIALSGIFNRNRPVTQRIILEFLTHNERKSPKRRTFRRARRLYKSFAPSL